MKIKTSVSLVVAIVLAIITTKVGLDLMKDYRGNATLTSRVIVAKKAMTPGYVIKEADLDSQAVPVNLVPANALRDPKDVAGRTVIASIVPGQTMLEAMMAPKGAGAGLAAIVPAGMRAVAVDVSDSSAVAGMIERGSKVDVIATLRRGDQTIAKAVLENVEVHSIQRAISGYSSKGGQTVPIDNGPVKSVTLLVTPKQASSLELAKAGGGAPRLVLRGNGDATTSDGLVSERELVGIPEEPPKVEPPPVAVKDDTFENVPPPEEDKGRPVEIIRNGQSSTIYITDEEKKKQEEAEGAPASAVLSPAGNGKTATPKRRNPQE